MHARDEPGTVLAADRPRCPAASAPSSAKPRALPRAVSPPASASSSSRPRSASSSSASPRTAAKPPGVEALAERAQLGDEQRSELRRRRGPRALEAERRRGQPVRLGEVLEARVRVHADAEQDRRAVDQLGQHAGELASSRRRRRSASEARASTPSPRATRAAATPSHDREPRELGGRALRAQQHRGEHGGARPRVPAAAPAPAARVLHVGAHDRERRSARVGEQPQLVLGRAAALELDRAGWIDHGDTIGR